MIHTSKQLKDKVRNISHGNNAIAQMMIRNFIMERFLERVSLSEYKKNFVLKGGMLVAALVGIDARATMDIDTTVKALPLNETAVVNIVNEILSIPVEDGISFTISKVTNIMTDFEYPGIRMALEARLDRLKQRIKIDISTDDVITPSAIKYEYRLMFEDRKIELMTYTTETLLAEKIQTIFSAIEIEEILRTITEDTGLPMLWELYRRDNFYVGNMEWIVVCETVCAYITKYLVKQL